MKSSLRLIILMTGAALLTGLCAQEQSGQADPQMEALAGQKLNANKVSDLEAAIAKNPDDLSARTQLLGYYFRARFTSAEAKEGHRKHVLWIIKNRPEATIAGLSYCGINAILDNDGYSEAKQLWLEQTQAHSTNAAILGHAAQFFLIHDRHLAEDLLIQAQTIE